MGKLYSLEGNRQLLDGGAMFGNAPRPMWEKWLLPDEKNRVELACRSLLIESEGKTWLFDTGIGAFFAPELAERYGVQDQGEHLLLDNLLRLGIAPEDVDFIVLSHLHFDHAGGLLTPWNSEKPGEYQLAFPSARFIVSEAAWERAKKPHIRDRASFIPGLVPLLEDSGRLTLVRHEPGQQYLCPELPGEQISFFRSDGHTPGQLHSCFQGDQTAVFFCGDLIPGVSWLHHPITMGYDRFPELLIDEKIRITAQAMEEQWLLFYTHDPKWAASRCRVGDKQRITPFDPLRELKGQEF